MLYETIDLYAAFRLPREGKEGGYLYCYRADRGDEARKSARSAVLLLPGGGYGMISGREGDPVALRLLAEGLAVFRLQYTVFAPFPVPLIEAAMASAFIRKNARRYGVQKNGVCVMGFSAGGHLAGMLSTMFADDCLRVLDKDRALVRPDAAVLCYPVITTERGRTHEGTAQVISGGDEALRQYLSIERRVAKDSVPVFAWHTVTDDLVPVESSLRLANAYREQGVPFELHLFERGVHGLSLANEEVSGDRRSPLYNENVQSWVPLALRWLRLRGFRIHTQVC